MSKFSDKTISELEGLLTDKRESLRETRFSISGAGDTKPHERREMKRDVARILTEMRDRQLTQ